MKSHRKLWLLVACLFGAENYLKAPEAMVAKNTTVRPRTDTISTSYGFHGQAGEGEPVSPGEMDALSTSKTTSSAGTPQNGSVDGAIDTSGKNAASKPSTASGGWNFVTGKSDATSSKANSDGTLTITDTTDAQTGAVNPVHPGAEGVDLSGLDSQPAVKSEVNTSTDKSEADNSNINTSGSVKNLTSDKSEADKSKETSVNPISDEKINEYVTKLTENPASGPEVVDDMTLTCLKNDEPTTEQVKANFMYQTFRTEVVDKILNKASEVAAKSREAAAQVTAPVVEKVPLQVRQTINIISDIQWSQIPRVGAKGAKLTGKALKGITRSITSVFNDALIKLNVREDTEVADTGKSIQGLSEQISKIQEDIISLQEEIASLAENNTPENQAIVAEYQGYVDNFTKQVEFYTERRADLMKDKFDSSGNLIKTPTPQAEGQAVIQEGPNGVPHVTEEEFKNQYSQLTQELQNQLEVTSGKLQRNKTTGQFYDATFADVNARIDLINNLPNNTRATIQNELATINTSESTIGSIKRTAGSLKKAVVGSKAPIVTSSQKSAGRLVQSAIDNLTGKDTLSGESIYSLPQEVQTKLINDVAARLNEKGLFDSRNQGNDALRAQIITNAINDLIMPKILPDDVKMSSAIASDGTYSSTVTKGNRIITSKVDNKGNMTERTMSTTDPTSNEKTTFKTTYNSSQGLLGSAKTVMTKTNASGNVTTTQDVSDSDGKLISAVTDYCTSMTMTDVAVGFTKVGVIGAKQVIINGVSTLVSIPIATTVGVAGLVAVKAGSMLSGADFSKPVIKAAVNLGFDLAGGGERVVGFSANKGQLFTSGGVGNKTANFVQGKGFTASAVDPNEKIYNPIGESVNGLVSAVAGKIAPVWSGKQMFSNPTPVSQAAAVAA